MTLSGENTKTKTPAPDFKNATVRTVKLELSYDGTAYHGWQRQPNGITVQEVLEERLKKLFAGAGIRVQGSSRTDAGVHALALTGSCRLPEHPYIPLWKMHKALNRLLPPDIRVRSVEEAEGTFNARFSALAKSYIYVINTGDVNPFTCRYSWHLNDLTEIDALQKAIALLQGKHDFSTFAVDSSKIENPVRTILRTEVVRFGPLVCLYFLGDGFLYKMVRSMAGALSFAGRGKLPPEAIGGMLEARNRLACKDTAPAHGLFLKRVFYTPGEWELDRVEKPPFWIS